MLNADVTPPAKRWYRNPPLLIVIGLFMLILPVGVAILALPFVQPLKVQGSGMASTLNDGDRILMRKSAGPIERGDIVIFRFPLSPDKVYLKRVVALPGETVRIDDDGVLYINGNRTEEPYLDATNNMAPRSVAQKTLDTDFYWVMGDNRDASYDSRSWGPLEQSFIYGKVVGRYWPPRRIDND